MPKVIITNCNSDESPLCEFGVVDGDVLDVEAEMRPDGTLVWIDHSWGDGSGLEIERDECMEITTDNQNIH